MYHVLGVLLCEKGSQASGAHWSVGEADLGPTAIGVQCGKDRPGCTGGWREERRPRLCLWRARESATQMTLKPELKGKVGIHQVLEGGQEFQAETLETV